MPDDLLVRIAADPSDLKKGLGEASREVDDFSDGLKDLATTAAAAFGAREIFDFLKDCVNEASAAQEATVKLTAALRAQGITSKRVANDITDFSSALQSSTRFNDEAITDVQRMLVSLGQLSGQGLQDATRATLDLAAGLGIDLTTAAQMVGKAAAGSIGTFSRYGLVVKDTGDSARDFAGVLDQINQKFGGAATAEVEGYAGATAQLANSFSDLKESVGGALLPGLEDAATGIKEVIQAATTDSSGLTRFALALATIGNSEWLRAFNKLKEDGGLLGDETNATLAAQRVSELEAEYGRVSARLHELQEQQNASGDVNTNVTGINQALADLDRLGEALDAAKSAQEKAGGTTSAPRVATQEELDKLAKEKKAWLDLWEARLGAGMDFVQEDLDANKAQEASIDEQMEASQELEEIRRKAHAAHMAELEAQMQAQMDLTQMELDEAAHQRRLQQEKERRQSLQDTQAVYSAVGNAAVNALEDVALNSEDAGEAAEQALRAVARQLIQIAIARIIANAGVAGSNVAARDTATMGVGGVVTGLAAAAAVAALAGKIPALHDGGVIGGPPGRDPSIVRVERGERILSREQNAAFESGGMGGGGSYTFNFNSILPPDEAQLRVAVRDHILPAMAALQRQRMA